MSRLHRAPTEAVIEVRGLCNRFGSQSVHENLDLDLYKGEILAVVGALAAVNPCCCAASLACVAPVKAKYGCSAKTCRACLNMNAHW